jgi:cytochrome b subunit of formate dehydrogenase
MHHVPPVRMRPLDELDWRFMICRMSSVRLSAALLALALGSCAAPDSPEQAGRRQGARPPVAVAAAAQTSTTEEITELVRGSVHTKLDCAECHAPRPGSTAAQAGSEHQRLEATCDSCHREQADTYATSVHARLEPEHKTRAAVCAQCHGDHDIQRATDPRSSVNKRNVSALCSGCHQKPEVAPRLRAGAVLAGSQYLESIHGRALVERGLLVAPSCVDCHGRGHALRPVADPEAPVSRARVATTCAKCHEGVNREYALSNHAQALAAGDPKAPTCPVCHTAHGIVGSTADFRRSSDQICGRCHATRRDRYLETYHGRAHHLGDLTVASCYDCHGAHAVLKTSDPRSTVSAGNKVSTCRKCHANATPSFAAFMPHADHKDAKNYPALHFTFLAMTGLLLGTFVFFALHTAFWLGRSLLAWRKDPDAFHGARQAARKLEGARLLVRFRPVDRFCHLLVIVSFLLLVATGMPLKFSSTAWAASVFDIVGGVKAAARLHRFGAIMTFCYFGIHLLSLWGPLMRRRSQMLDEKGRFSVTGLLRVVFGPESPAPNLQDLRDIAAHARWFVGKGPRPSFDRFTYWEKFDYMAVFWGVTVIGLSGLVMWFPVKTAQIVPGWVINVAHLVHSDEALLAAGFIFTFHFFNSHFRPEKFPLDPTIFSGHTTEADMRHEHGREYERLEASGRLDGLVTTGTEWANWKWVLTPFGALALCVGVTMVWAIFYALLFAGH